jgi:hypothetical protein
MPHLIHELESLHARSQIALDELSVHWGRSEMVSDVATLTNLVSCAEKQLPVFEAQEDHRGLSFKVRVIGLRSLFIIGQNELDRARAFAIAEVAKRMRDEVLPLHLALRPVVDNKPDSGSTCKM